MPTIPNLDKQQRGSTFRLIYSIWIALGAFLQLCMTYKLLRTYPLFDSLSLMVLSSTYIAYTIAKIRQIIRITAQNGLKWFKSFTYGTIAELTLFSLACLTALYTFLQLHFFEQIWLFFAGIIAVGYSIPLFPALHSNNGRLYWPLRRMGILKTHLVALIWTLSTALLPALHIGEPPNSLALWLIVATRYLFVFALTLPFEIRDIDLDKSIGIQTLPILIGKERTLSVGRACLLLATFLTTTHYLFLSFRPFVWTVLIASFFACAYLSEEARRQNTLWYYTFALDGLFVGQAIGILFCPR